MAESGRTNRGIGLLLAAAALAIVGWCAVSAIPAKAATPEITAFSSTPSTTQAGGHPDVKFEMRFTNGNPDARAIRTHFPTGFIGNVHVAPTCTLTEFNQASCPVDSQIAVFSSEVGGGLFYNFPAYNMETTPDQAGLLGFLVPVFGFPGFLELSGRTDSDYGLDSVGTPLIRGFPFIHLTGYLWGVPADPIHNVMRFTTPLENIGACISLTKGCFPGSEFESPTHAEPTIPPRPFLQNPTTCGVPLTTTADLEYYDGTELHAEAPWPPTTGCKQLSFNPSLTVKPTTGQADTASGVDVNLKVPQTQSPISPSPSELRTSRVTLPEGFTVNPNAADGKLACADADTAIGTLFAATCPEHSKVGTVMVDTAALPAPIPGALYLGQPKPGERYRLILAADGFATHVKLTVSVRLDPRTGRVSTIFEDLPQTPLQEIDMHFFGSERGLLATPTQCGTYEIEGEFVPWDAELTTRHTTSFMTIDSGPGGTPCPGGPRPFAPGLTAGTTNSTAGMHSPFSLALNRNDGEQNLTGVGIVAPPGFTATLKGVPYCPEAAIARLSSSGYTALSEEATPSCPAASRIGSVTAGAGAGTHPLYVPGNAYLAGPYKGAPLSLVVAIPALSGPYDLGNVAVRAAIDVDPVTAQVKVASDPLPQILEGIPLRTRSILIDLDRPGFTLNPTNCDPFSLSASLSADEGATSTPSTHFQVANCSDLGFTPKLDLKLLGSTKRLGHPSLRANLSSNPGETNFSRIVTALPKSLLIDNAHIGTVCTRPQFAANACPAGSLMGEAQATTPLLDRPLSGKVYLRSSGAKLPDLAIDLEGQFDIEVVGHVDTPKKGGLRTTFVSLPDAPVSSFSLNLLGGSKGLLYNSENLCKSPPKASVQMVGQNGVALNAKTKLKTACAKARNSKAKSKRRDNRHRGAQR